MKNKKKQAPETERRKWPRLKPSSIPSLKSVALGQGTEIDAIDISQGGMLVETEVRLRPQMRIHLKLVTSDGIIRLEGSVLRSSIASLKGIPRYKSAIAFEQPFNQLNQLSGPVQPQSEPPKETPSFDESVDEGDNPFTRLAYGEFDENSAILTVIARDISDSSIRENVKLNDW